MGRFSFKSEMYFLLFLNVLSNDLLGSFSRPEKNNFLKRLAVTKK
jgi:hypothetical protein